jgi:hypothetical protein
MKGRLYKMDKRKYQTKTLIAEFQDLFEHEEFRFTEMAYRLKDGSIIIEYDGKGHSLYGIRIGFCKCIPRKGVYSIDNSDYEMWKRIRRKEIPGFFVDWEEEIEDQLNEDHENVLKCVGADELPF